MFNKPNAPSKAAILLVRDHVLEQNPDLLVVGAHLGSMEGNFRKVGDDLDRYPNFAVNLADRIYYFVKAPRADAIAFVTKYQDSWQTRAGKKSLTAYSAKVGSMTIAGVPVRNVTPLDHSPIHPDWVLLNVHGGGFTSDSGSLTESVPMANIMHVRVVSVLYRLAPEHPFPAAVDDTVAVYRELLKTYKPTHIALYGTSAGAILTAETAVHLKQLNVPLPAALGIFSGMGDFSQPGDSQAMYGLRGLASDVPLPGPGQKNSDYVGSTNPRDPVLSPLYADLHGMPPTLFITTLNPT